jgi:hypothetical protein
MIKRPVIRFFSIFRKKACWHLPGFKMILYAVTADAFSWAGLIGAVAMY